MCRACNRDRQSARKSRLADGWDGNHLILVWLVIDNAHGATSGLYGGLDEINPRAALYAVSELCGHEHRSGTVGSENPELTGAARLAAQILDCDQHTLRCNAANLSGRELGNRLVFDASTIRRMHITSDRDETGSGAPCLNYELHRVS